MAREQELAEIDLCVRRGSRLVTLAGPPGAGKTRLATRYAQSLLEEADERTFAGGVWAVDSSTCRTLDEWLEAVCRMLSVSLEDTKRAPGERLERALAAMPPSLLLLDNVEHLVADLAVTIPRWLATAPNVRCLLTSRESLRIPEEVLIKVPPLPVPQKEMPPEKVLSSPAVQLLVARAQIAGDREKVESLAEIAIRLAGIPLAIELAAARVPVLGVEGLRERLGQGLGVLGPAPRSAPARHATLPASIEWSWRLLDPAEQRVLGALSLFRGTFSAGLAERVAEADGERSVLDVVQSLVDKSLVATVTGQGEGRPRLRLYEPIREAVRLFVDEEGIEDAAARFIEALAGLAEVVLRRGDVRSLAPERENLLHAHELSRSGSRVTSQLWIVLGLDSLLALEGPARLHAQILEKAVASVARSDAEPGLRARVHRAHARALSDRGHTEQALSVLEVARQFANLAKEPILEAQVQGDLGLNLLLRGDPGAVNPLEEAAERLRAAGDVRAEERVVTYLGMFHRAQGEVRLAASFYRRALFLAEKSDDSGLSAKALSNLAVAENIQGRHADAERLWIEALQVQTALADHWGAAVTRANLGIAQQEQGRFREAESCYEQARVGAARVGHLRLEIHALKNLGGLRMEEGRLEEARVLLQEGHHLARDAEDSRLEIAIEVRLGALEARAGALETATEILAGATRKARRGRDPYLRVAAHVAKGHLDLVRARRDEARGKPGERARGRAVRRLGLAHARDGSRGLLPSDDVRLSYRLLAQDLHSDTLVVAGDGTFFHRPEGRAVALGDRAILARLLSALASERVAFPGRPVPISTLVAVGWPGEKLLASAARNRLKVAVSTLRRLGLDGLLHHEGDGYFLDDRQPLARIATNRNLPPVWL